MQKDADEVPFEFMPAFDYSERLRQLIVDTIKLSAAIDFLSSPLATKENLLNMKKKIVLFNTYPLMVMTPIAYC